MKGVDELETKENKDLVKPQIFWGITKVYKCGRCKEILPYGRYANIIINFCPICGVGIDWSDEDERC